MSSFWKIREFWRSAAFSGGRTFMLYSVLVSVVFPCANQVPMPFTLRCLSPCPAQIFRVRRLFQYKGEVNIKQLLADQRDIEGK